MIRGNDRGQAMIESAIALPIAIIGVSGFFALLWSIAVSLMAHHTLYELLICQELFPQPENCQQIAESQLRQVLLFGHLDQLELYRNSRKSEVTASISFPFRQRMQLQESLSLPLTSL